MLIIISQHGRIKESCDFIFAAESLPFIAMLRAHLIDTLVGSMVAILALVLRDNYDACNKG